jgi:hypothetical protein
MVGNTAGLDTVLYWDRHISGDRAHRLRGAAAMKDAKPEQIVAFLTGHRDHFNPIGYGTPMTDHVPADWYERVLRDNERLREALQALADDDAVPPWIRTLARRALEPKP